jgi:hypothetical protein
VPGGGGIKFAETEATHKSKLSKKTEQNVALLLRNSLIREDPLLL